MCVCVASCSSQVYLCCSVVVLLLLGFFLLFFLGRKCLHMILSVHQNEQILTGESKLTALQL